MKRFALFLIASTLAAATLPLHEGGFSAGPDGLPAGWKVWSPRAEIAPRTFLDSVHYRTRPASLAISGNANAAVYGGWERTVEGVEAGAWYRFTAYYRSAGVPYESLQIFPRVDWSSASHCDVPAEPGRQAMTRRDLASDWKERFAMTPAHAQRCVDELYRDFCAALATGGEVQLRGIGTWKTAVRKNGRRVIQLRPSRAMVRAANRMPPRSKETKASQLSIPKQPSARIPVLIAQIFDKWPSRPFLQRVGGIAGLDSSRLLRILEEMVRCDMRYDPTFTVPFLDFLQQQFCP